MTFFSPKNKEKVGKKNFLVTFEEDSSRPNVKSTPPRKLKKAHPGVDAERRLRLNYFFSKIERQSLIRE